MEQIREWLDQGNSILVLPGWRNSGPTHWQSHWERGFPGLKRVQQANWDEPVAADWVHALQQAIQEAPGRVILVAHSLGCIAQAHWAATHRLESKRIAGALLVAPADPMREGLAASIRGFLPLPILPLPYPSVVVASDNDPVCSVERTQSLIRYWGSELRLLNGAGHINAEAGFGSWPEGLRHLRRLIRNIRGKEAD